MCDCVVVLLVSSRRRKAKRQNTHTYVSSASSTLSFQHRLCQTQSPGLAAALASCAARVDLEGGTSEYLTPEWTAAVLRAVTLVGY